MATQRDSRGRFAPSTNATKTTKATRKRTKAAAAPPAEPAPLSIVDATLSYLNLLKTPEAKEMAAKIQALPDMEKRLQDAEAYLKGRNKFDGALENLAQTIKPQLTTKSWGLEWTAEYLHQVRDNYAAKVAENDTFSKILQQIDCHLEGNSDWKGLPQAAKNLAAIAQSRLQSLSTYQNILRRANSYLPGVFRRSLPGDIPDGVKNYTEVMGAMREWFMAVHEAVGLDIEAPKLADEIKARANSSRILQRQITNITIENIRLAQEKEGITYDLQQTRGNLAALTSACCGLICMLLYQRIQTYPATMFLQKIASISLLVAIILAFGVALYKWLQVQSAKLHDSLQPLDTEGMGEEGEEL